MNLKSIISTALLSLFFSSCGSNSSTLHPELVITMPPKEIYAATYKKHRIKSLPTFCNKPKELQPQQWQLINGSILRLKLNHRNQVSPGAFHTSSNYILKNSITTNNSGPISLFSTGPIPDHSSLSLYQAPNTILISEHLCWTASKFILYSKGSFKTVEVPQRVGRMLNNSSTNIMGIDETYLYVEESNVFYRFRLDTLKLAKKPHFFTIG